VGGINYGGRLSLEVPSVPIYAQAVVHAIIELLSYYYYLPND
jgi:hypothetical protein